MQGLWERAGSEGPRPRPEKARKQNWCLQVSGKASRRGGSGAGANKSGKRWLEGETGLSGLWKWAFQPWGDQRTLRLQKERGSGCVCVKTTSCQLAASPFSQGEMSSIHHHQAGGPLPCWRNPRSRVRQSCFQAQHRHIQVPAASLSLSLLASKWVC